MAKPGSPQARAIARGEHNSSDGRGSEGRAPRVIGHALDQDEPVLDPRLEPLFRNARGLVDLQRRYGNDRDHWEAYIAERLRDDPVGARQEIEEVWTIITTATAEVPDAIEQANDYVTRLPAEMARLRRTYMVASRSDPGARKLLPVAYNGSTRKGVRLGYFKTPLDGGTFGYLQRRPLDCVQAALASYLQIPPYLVPDFDLDRLIAAGKDPEEIERISTGKVGQWLEKNAVTLVGHPTRLPTSSGRWIGLMTGDDDDPTANGHALLMDGRTVIFDTAWLVPPRKDEPVSNYSLDDIEVGFTIDRR